MCDAICTTTFSETDFQIYNKESQCIWSGKRNLHNRLWDIQVDLLSAVSPFIHRATIIMSNNITNTDLVRYHHHSLGNTTKNALPKGIKKGLLDTFPGLDEKYLLRIYHIELIWPKATDQKIDKYWNQPNFEPSQYWRYVNSIGTYPHQCTHGSHCWSSHSIGIWWIEWSISDNVKKWESIHFSYLWLWFQCHHWRAA